MNYGMLEWQKNEKEELDKWNRPAVSSETNSVKEAESEQKIREWTARALLWKKINKNEQRKKNVLQKCQTGRGLERVSG